MPEILTVGHSTHELSELVALLSGAAIEAIADVQRFPGSRRHPQFASASLAQTLPQAKIGCLHLSELGGRRAPRADSPNTAWRNDSFRGYADHLPSHEFTVGLSRLEAMAAANRTAIMCAEAVWWRCHRRLLADVLLPRGWSVRQVMPDGRLVVHELSPIADAGRMACRSILPPPTSGCSGKLWGSCRKVGSCG